MSGKFRWLIVVICSVHFTAAPVVSTAASTSAAEQIRTFLEGLDAGDTPVLAGRQLNEPELLSRLYRSNDHQPLWLPGSPLAREASALLAEIGESTAHGLNAERYHRSALERVAEAESAVGTLARELLLTDAFLSQALHRGRGAVEPPNIDADWQLPQAEVDAVALLLDIAMGRNRVSAALDALWPATSEYQLLVERRAEILASGEENSVRIAPGPILRPGQTNDRIIMLKERLLGPGDHSAIYDDDLRQEVVAFQWAAGLEPDGLVGQNTLELLNETRVSWIDRIDANLERWRWLPRMTPETYIRVNIAAYTLRAIENGRQTLAMNVIVGQPYRQTPVFTETLKYLVLNPSWNVPYSIATKDKLPLLRANASAEAAKGFEAKPNGSDVFVSVDAIDWSNVTARNFNYLLRQRAGPLNALGQVKFMMPNPHAVYLHDTPSRELFARQERTFSSGCIRLERPRDLITWLLERDNPQSAVNIDSQLASGQTHTINLKTPVPVYLVYFTAFADDEGKVVFRRDVYARDRVVIESLRRQNRG
ncbi:MAG: L,D-transpeptidase family protein [Woeseiaceae bacterium]|nr:L,D-transpeptidase family protein [Woeseiaceae bacterium]